VLPETRYAKTADGVHIAYQTVGNGPPDLVLVCWLLHIEHIWTWPVAASFLRRLASISRLILFDRRGTGLSDHLIDREQQLSLDVQMDDIRAVMDAAGSERATLLSMDQISTAAVFAATFPDRTAGLVAYGAVPRTAWAPDYPWGATPETWAEDAARVEAAWGTIEDARVDAEMLWPEAVDDDDAMRHFAAFWRHAGGPGDALSWLEADWATDVREILPSVRVPTAVIHRVGDPAFPLEHGRYVADHIPGAKLIELEGHHFWFKDDLADAIESFLVELRQESADLDRVLATVLFTDIVGSTERVADIGDRAWKELLERHHAIVRGLLARYRGTEMDTAGDGFFATFDGPARAVRCALAIVEAVRSLGIEVRAGVHTGEVERIDDKVGGMAVVIAARVAAMAAPSQVLASATVRDLTAGSGLVFEDAGPHELKGVPGEWRLCAVGS
jgi:class 3 adenylate cyclase/pimeloyl-ACP methyl ester carboxylesterase